MSIHTLILQNLSALTLTSLDELAEQHLQAVGSNSSLQHVMTTALRCTSIGFGFAAGYRSALQCLLPELDHSRWAAMCVTEQQGNHPKSIQCEVDEQGVINGTKTFVTMADQSPQLLVVAKLANQDSQLERPILKAVLCDSLTQGVDVQVLPPLPMVPEIGHGLIRFENIQGRLLEGDGYEEYSKRFRLLEDAHVLMAFVSVLLSISYRHKLSPALFEQALVIITSLASLQSDLLQSNSVMHLQLAGLFDRFRDVCGQFENHMQDLPEELAAQWLRDKKLFGVANKAREVRRQRAYEALGLSDKLS